MERLGEEDRGQVSAIRKVALASLIGTTIEWYDFFIYGTAAALVFPALFFPEFSETAGTLAAFATFGVGFFARPVGGIVFGHFGDRVGRKTMLVLTLTIMGVATTLIGLLPTYAAIGVAAPLLLVVLRFAQGLGVGGEWGGAVLMAVEHSPAERRGFFGSWPQMGVPAGLILSNLIFLAVATLPEEQFLAWGWRIPFLLSIFLVGVGLFIRLRIMESPAFRRVQESNTEARMPIVDVVRTYSKQVLLAAGAFLVINAYFYILVSYLINYATAEAGMSNSTILTVVLIASVVSFFAMPLFAALSDRSPAGGRST
jgi:MFS transporter, MHS family, shikimate and dehydroshikimate transport protein